MNIFPIAQKDAQIADVLAELKRVEFNVAKKDQLQKRLHELKNERLALGGISTYVRFFIDIMLRETFLSDLEVFENCLINFKKHRLLDLRSQKARSHEELIKLDKQLKDMYAEVQKSNQHMNSIGQLNSKRKTLSSQIRVLDNKIDILDLTVDKFWDEIFSTHDWILEKEKENSAFEGSKLKEEVELFKSQIDKLLDRYIKLIEHGLPVHILRGKPLKIESNALEMVFKKLISNEELLIITVIGEQSSAKSSLLNALFGCDFRTSAGRCTVGIYMNLVRYKVRISICIICITLKISIKYFSFFCKRTKKL